ncbi:unnamed protein product, partial [marine sediment metagenome]
MGLGADAEAVGRPVRMPDKSVYASLRRIKPRSVVRRPLFVYGRRGNGL